MLPDPPSEIALLPSTHHPALDPLSSPENLTTLHPRREKSRPNELDGKLLTHFSSSQVLHSIIQRLRSNSSFAIRCPVVSSHGETKNSMGATFSQRVIKVHLMCASQANSISFGPSFRSSIPLSGVVNLYLVTPGARSPYSNLDDNKLSRFPSMWDISHA